MSLQSAPEATAALAEALVASKILGGLDTGRLAPGAPADLVAFDTETDSLDYMNAHLVGLSLAVADGEACYVPLAHEGGPNVPLQQARDWLALMLEDPGVPKVGHDLKHVAHALATARLPIAGFAFDLHLGSFLIQTVRSNHFHRRLCLQT